MMIFKKKQIVTTTLVALLVVAGYLNFVYLDSSLPDGGMMVSGEPSETEEINYGEAKFVSNTNSSKNDYFSEAKINKEKAKSEALNMLRQVSENPAATAEEKKIAQQQILQMAKKTETEMTIENILKGKGFSEVSAYFSEDMITVAIRTDGLTPADVAKIRDVVIAESKLKADQIKIMEIKT